MVKSNDLKQERKLFKVNKHAEMENLKPNVTQKLNKLFI